MNRVRTAQRCVRLQLGLRHRGVQSRIRVFMLRMSTVKSSDRLPRCSANLMLNDVI